MKSDAHKEVKELLANNCSGYVLITCGLPTSNGEMPVEMSHGGDQHLVSYLLEGALGHIEEHASENSML